MVMAVVMDGAIAAVAVIIMDGAEVAAITMVGGIILIGGDFSSRGRLSWRPLCHRPGSATGTARRLIRLAILLRSLLSLISRRAASCRTHSSSLHKIGLSFSPRLSTFEAAP
jgi:hypothetical protein